MSGNRRLEKQTSTSNNNENPTEASEQDVNKVGDFTAQSASKATTHKQIKKFRYGSQQNCAEVSTGGYKTNSKIIGPNIGTPPYYHK